MPNHTQIKLSVKKKGSGKYANSKKIDVLDAPPAMAGDRMAALLSRFTFLGDKLKIQYRLLY